MRVPFSSFVFSLIVLSGCVPSVGEAPPPNLPAITSISTASQPGMPDRPGAASEVVQPYFREDTLEAIGATNRPQLVIFWSPSYDTGGCLECETLRTGIQELEAEFWDQVDFVYLNQEREDVQALKASLGIPDYQYRMSIVLFSREGDMVRRFYDVTRNQGIGFSLNDTVIRQALDKYLSEQEEQT